MSGAFLGVRKTATSQAGRVLTFLGLPCWWGDGQKTDEWLQLGQGCVGVRVGRGRGPEAKEWGAEGRGRKGKVVGNEVMGGPRMCHMQSCPPQMGAQIGDE